MRTVTVAPLSYCHANERSNDLCNKINYAYRQGKSTKEIAEELKLSVTSVRRYYYGYHNCMEAHAHWKSAWKANQQLGYDNCSLNQVRIGTSVSI